MSQAEEPTRASKKKTTRAKTTVSPKTPPAKSAPVKPAPVASPDEVKGDLVAELWLRFGRFGWDVAGLLLIAFALITLVGFVVRVVHPDAASGLLISWWMLKVSQAFGWGWPLLVVSIALLGYLCLRQRVANVPPIPLARILALEGVAFALLALFAIWNGWSLARVEAGQDGGWIGWGLAWLIGQILPTPWSTLLLLVLILLLGSYGVGLTGWLFRRLQTWLNAVNPAGAAVPAAPVPTAQKSAAAVDEDDPPQLPLPGIPLGRDPNLPPLDLLLDEQNIRPDEGLIQETARKIEHTLAEFGVPASVKGYRVGPTVTQYAVEPGFIDKTGPDGEPIKQKVRVSQISTLQRDLTLSLSAERLRIEAPVPGRSYVGIEVPNRVNTLVRMRSLLESEAFIKLTSPLAVALGRDVSGQPVVADLSRMPHLLIAGTTGSGKSICIEAITTCLAMNNTPADLRMALLDPKMVELARFNGLPHLFGKVETEIERMLGVLRWALVEMDRRYRLLEEARARDVIVYNRKMEKRGQPKLPRIVLIIDELADLMMTAPDQTEHNLIRLAQMARATGIHMVVATQRPSTDVVTGLIKANFPARLAFSVASSIDSRVILDVPGAETLLGKGDMLFLNPEAGTPLRAQGALVSDDEIEKVINYWKQKTAADPAAQAEAAPPWEELLMNGAEEDGDKLVEQAVKIVRSTQRASTSLLQRRLRVGYPRAARLMDELEELGVVGPSQGGGKERDVLLPPDDGSEDDDLPPEGGSSRYEASEDGPGNFTEHQSSAADDVTGQDGG